MHFRTWLLALGLLPLACSSEPSCMNKSECGESNTAPANTEPNPEPSEGAEQTDAESELERVVFLDGTTDEALEHLLAVEPQEDDAHEIVLGMPSSNELSAQEPAAFSFHVQGTQGQLRVHPRVQSEPLLPPWLRRGVFELGRLLGPERVAHAHGAPFNGDGYYLQFRSADGELVAGVFTAQGLFAPSTIDWQHWADAPQPLTLRIDWASFEENEVVADGGPYQGLEFEFEIR